jgi:hypothetical protein
MTTALAARRRALGRAERFYWLLDQVSSTNFVLVAEIEASPPVEALARVLARLGERHPLLRCRIVVDAAGKVVFEPVEGGLPCFELVESVGDAVWHEEVAAELDHPFDPQSYPLARVLLRRLSGGTRLCFTFNHGIADATSGLALVVEALGLLAGAEAAPPRTMPDAQERGYPRRFLGVGGRLRQLWLLLRDGLEWSRIGRARPIPGFQTDSQTPRSCRILPFDPPMPATEALRARCREAGTSVQGALCAAQLLSIRPEYPETGRAALIVGSAVDMRPSIEGFRVERADLGMYASYVATAHGVAAEAAFWPLARQIRQSVRLRIARGNPCLVWSTFPGDWLFPAGPRGAEALFRMVSRMPPSTFVTNLGAAASTEGGLRSLRFAMAPQAGSPLCTAAVTEAGGLRCANAFNATAMDGEQMRRIAVRFGRILEAAIG